MKKAIKNYHETESYFSDMLAKVRDEILGQCAHIITDLFDGRICVRYYHDGEPNIEKNTFFECDCDGYGRELFIDTIVTHPETGKISVMLHDSEDTYNPWWDLSDFYATDALYLLSELEDIVNYISEYDEEIVKDWEPECD